MDETRQPVFCGDSWAPIQCWGGGQQENEEEVRAQDQKEDETKHTGIAYSLNESSCCTDEGMAEHLNVLLKICCETTILRNVCRIFIRKQIFQEEVSNEKVSLQLLSWGILFYFPKTLNLSPKKGLLITSKHLKIVSFIQNMCWRSTK